MCDGVAGKAPDLGLKSHVKARGLQGDDAASAARFRLTLAAFRLRCRPPVAIEAPERSQCIARARRSPPTALYGPSAPDIDRFLRIWPSIEPLSRGSAGGAENSHLFKFRIRFSKGKH